MGYWLHITGFATGYASALLGCRQLGWARILPQADATPEAGVAGINPKGKEDRDKGNPQS